MFNGFAWYYQGTAVRLGVDSTGNRNNGGAQNVRVINYKASGGGSAIGWGPQIDVGSNCFWDYFTDGSSIGSLESWTVTLARVSNVVTATITGGFGGSTHDLPNGAHISLYQNADTSFNGTFTITSVADNTHFTFAQTGPNATTSGGTAFGDKVFGMLVDPGSGPGSGIIIVNNYSGTGIKFYAGDSGGSMQADGVTVEAPFIVNPPGVWFSGSLAGGLVHHVEMADVTGPMPAVIVDQGLNPNNFYTEFLDGSGCDYDGPMTVGGGTFSTPCSNGGYSTSQISTPARTGAFGIFNGKIWAQDDNSRRSFAPAAVRYQNLANTDSASWTFSGAHTLTPVVAPDGTANAASQVASASGISTAFLPSGGNLPVTIAVGQWLIGGAWVQSQTGNGYDFNVGVQLSLAGSGNYLSQGFGYCSGLFGLRSNTPCATGSSWDWVWFAYKVIGAGTPSTTVNMFTFSDASHIIQIYGPTFIQVPAGDLTDNEAVELARQLQPSNTVCGVASLCSVSGPLKDSTGALVTTIGGFSGTLTHANTANRTYTFTDASGNIPYVVGTLGIGNCLQGGPNPNEVSDTGSACGSGGGGSGTVTSVASGNLSPLLTTSVANPNTTAAISYALSTAAANTVFANCTGGTLAPSYCSLNLGMLPAGVGLTANPLSQFAATTSAQLRGVLSDETGTGVAVFGTLPTISAGPLTFNNTPLPASAGMIAIGSNALPMSNYFLGGIANQTGSFDSSTLTANRVINLVDGAMTIPQPTGVTANQWLQSLNATTGIFTKAQPAFTNLSGSLACGQLPALTGDATTSAGTCATVVGKVNGAAYPATPALHSSPVATASNTITYKVWPDCHTAGQVIIFTQSSDTIGCGSASALTLQTGGVNHVNQALLNFVASATNATGLVVTPANSAGGNEVFEITGTHLSLGASPPAITVGTGTIVAGNEGTAPTVGFPAAGVDGCYNDSTAHAELCSFNNDTALKMARIVWQGTVALNTAAISSASHNLTTAAHTGILTTDTVNCSANGSIIAVTGYVPSTGGILGWYTYPTSGNVNVDVINNTIGSITPGAITLNCVVTR